MADSSDTSNTGNSLTMADMASLANTLGGSSPYGSDMMPMMQAIGSKDPSKMMMLGLSSLMRPQTPIAGAQGAGQMMQGRGPQNPYAALGQGIPYSLPQAQGNYANGGVVGYDDGGTVQGLPPSDQPLAADPQSGGLPGLFSDPKAAALFNMGANIMATRRPDFLGTVGEGLAKGMQQTSQQGLQGAETQELNARVPLYQAQARIAQAQAGLWQQGAKDYGKMMSLASSLASGGQVNDPSQLTGPDGHLLPQVASTATSDPHAAAALGVVPSPQVMSSMPPPGPQPIKMAYNSKDNSLYFRGQPAVNLGAYQQLAVMGLASPMPQAQALGKWAQGQLDEVMKSGNIMVGGRIVHLSDYDRAKVADFNASKGFQSVQGADGIVRPDPRSVAAAAGAEGTIQGAKSRAEFEQNNKPTQALITQREKDIQTMKAATEPPVETGIQIANGVRTPVMTPRLDYARGQAPGLFPATPGAAPQPQPAPQPGPQGPQASAPGPVPMAFKAAAGQQPPMPGGSQGAPQGAPQGAAPQPQPAPGLQAGQFLGMPKYTPDQEGVMRDFAEKYMPEVLKEQSSAQDAMSKFDIMRQQLPTMIKTGKGAEIKADILSASQMIAQTLGGNSDTLAAKISAGEIFGKYAKQTGMEMARLYDGSRVAVQEMQTAIAANPGFQMSERGNGMLIDLMHNAAERASDKGAFMAQYYRENQGDPAALNPAAAEAAFAKAHPSIVYFSKAVPMVAKSQEEAARRWPPNTRYIITGIPKVYRVP